MPSIFSVDLMISDYLWRRPANSDGYLTGEPSPAQAEI